MANVDKLVVVS